MFVKVVKVWFWTNPKIVNRGNFPIGFHSYLHSLILPGRDEMEQCDPNDASQTYYLRWVMLHSIQYYPLAWWTQHCYGVWSEIFMKCISFVLYSSTTLPGFIVFDNGRGLSLLWFTDDLEVFVLWVILMPHWPITRRLSWLFLSSEKTNHSNISHVLVSFSSEDSTQLEARQAIRLRVQP